MRWFKRREAQLRHRWHYEYQKRARRVRADMKHLSGPKSLRIEADEAVAVCMIRNGIYYVEELLNHHRKLGVSGFLFIDNGSSDGTVEFLRSQADVTIVEVLLPVRDYETHMRVEAAKSIVQGGWFLFLDADEKHCLPYGENRQISDYLRYCNKRGYTAVVSHVLDMFSELPLHQTSMLDYSASVSRFNRYSLANIDKFDYFDQLNVSWSWFLRHNKLGLDDIKILFGGIRRTVFDEYCCLTTHRLVRNRSDIIMLRHPHCMSNVDCADFTGLIKHYKFCGDFRTREKAMLANGTWAHGEDVQRVNALERHPELLISSPESRTFDSVDDLLSEGFLVGSQDFFEEFF